MKHPLLILALLLTSAPSSAQVDAKCSGPMPENLLIVLETRTIDSETQEVELGEDANIEASQSGPLELQIGTLEGPIQLQVKPDA